MMSLRTCIGAQYQPLRHLFLPSLPVIINLRVFYLIFNSESGLLQIDDLECDKPIFHLLSYLQTGAVAGRNHLVTFGLPHFPSIYFCQVAAISNKHHAADQFCPMCSELRPPRPEDRAILVAWHSNLERSALELVTHKQAGTLGFQPYRISYM
jgi:hypothetical protein